ncbi:MAG: hypothetical protein H2069_05220 [Legionella sp.]|nr:hypothetical protein [Legionella sp.]
MKQFFSDMLGLNKQSNSNSQLPKAPPQLNMYHQVAFIDSPGGREEFSKGMSALVIAHSAGTGLCNFYVSAMQTCFPEVKSVKKEGRALPPSFNEYTQFSDITLSDYGRLGPEEMKEKTKELDNYTNQALDMHFQRLSETVGTILGELTINVAMDANLFNSDTEIFNEEIPLKIVEFLNKKHDELCRRLYGLSLQAIRANKDRVEEQLNKLRSEYSSNPSKAQQAEIDEALNQLAVLKSQLKPRWTARITGFTGTSPEKIEILDGKLESFQKKHADYIVSVACLHSAHAHFSNGLKMDKKMLQDTLVNFTKPFNKDESPAHSQRTPHPQLRYCQIFAREIIPQAAFSQDMRRVDLESSYQGPKPVDGTTPLSSQVTPGTSNLEQTNEEIKPFFNMTNDPHAQSENLQHIVTEELNPQRKLEFNQASQNSLQPGSQQELNRNEYHSLDEMCIKSDKSGSFDKHHQNREDNNLKIDSNGLNPADTSIEEEIMKAALEDHAHNLNKKEVVDQRAMLQTPHDAQQENPGSRISLPDEDPFPTNRFQRKPTFLEEGVFPSHRQAIKSVRHASEPEGVNKFAPLGFFVRQQSAHLAGQEDLERPSDQVLFNFLSSNKLSKDRRNSDDINNLDINQLK